MLEIRRLEKSYGTHRVLQGVDLEIAAGEVVALLGPNGAGKTTLVSIVAGLREPDGGLVRVDGVDALRYPERVRAQIGLAPQELGVYPTIAARDNLVFFARLAGVDRRRVDTRIEEVAEALALTDLLDRKVGVLSGGQKRRLHTAMALLHRPRILFLDEPTVGADVESRRQILNLVGGLAADGAAVCYATHYLPEVEELDARVAVAEHGWGTWDRLRSSPALLFEILVGKMLPSGLVILAQVAVLFGAGALLFGLRINGSITALVAMMFASTVFLLALSMMCVSIFRTINQLSAAANVGAMCVAGLGGALAPLSVMPSWAQSVAPASPAYWALQGFQAVVLEGGRWPKIAIPVLVLAGTSIVCGFIAALRFRPTDAKVWAA